MTELIPEVIIRFGAMPVSKSLMKWIEQFEDSLYYLVDSGNEWKDPTKQATDIIHCDERFLVDALAKDLKKATSSDWLQSWQHVNKATETVVNEYLTTLTEANEGQLIRWIREYLPTKSGLFIGNSMPIRDVDTFFNKTNKSIKLLANRGANGIDGVISSALGSGTVIQPMYLVIGDLSFYHDMNGLAMAQKYGLNLTIILVNNSGGGIFSFLPQATLPKHFETLFGTELALNFETIAELYQGNYQAPKTQEEFHEAMDLASFHKGLDIIEIKTNRYENVASHRELYQAVSKALKDHGYEN